MCLDCKAFLRLYLKKDYNATVYKNYKLQQKVFLGFFNSDMCITEIVGPSWTPNIHTGYFPP
jgi:hypothetical protein